MAELSGFFDAHLVNGEYDRVYLAESFAKYFASFVGNGIFAAKSDGLKVRHKESEGMRVEVLSGQAWINGYWYENTDNLTLTIDAADGVLNRIDSIVIRWDNIQRVIRLAVVKGNPGASPTAHTVWRSYDYYELKLADIYVKAGATKITQADISDKRYNSEECGIVTGIVEQLDTEDLGIQFDAFVTQYIHDAEERIQTVEDNLTSWIDTFTTASSARVNKTIEESQERFFDVEDNFNTLIQASEETFDNQIAEFKREFENEQSKINALIDAGEATMEQLDAIDVNTRIDKNISDIEELRRDVSDLNEKVNEESGGGQGGMGIEDDIYAGCYYVETATGVKEWINPPNKPGVEYRTIERFNDSPVYQKVLYTASLPNKTLVGIHIEAHYQNIIHVSGFAIDNENNMHYPFPIIMNGLTPIAIIQGVESDGGDESDVVIQTNENISHMTGYITVKYTK